MGEVWKMERREVVEEDTQKRAAFQAFLEYRA
jgi:hypothetical protein